MKTCRTCGQTKPLTDYVAYRQSVGHFPDCKDCQKAKRRAKAAGAAPAAATRKFTGTVTTRHGYVASRELLAIFDAVQAGQVGDTHAETLFFIGPSGCGKTEGAKHLAEVAALPFTKVDAPSMTDPEAWFGTREVVAVDGVSVTSYRPSTFVTAIQQPGVLLIDEANRIQDSHRQILNPLLDGTHEVTNPLTGDVVRKHPGCYIILSGNRGLQFTGTFAVDPSLMTRSLVVEFGYLGAEDEARVVTARYDVDPAVAALFVRFANESRSRVESNPDMLPISTREVLAACRLVANGLGIDLAAQIAIINGASDEGGAESVRSSLQKIWAGIRPAGGKVTTEAEADEATY